MILIDGAILNNEMMSESTMGECAPVLLLGFNRPDFMAAQIDAIRPARPRRVYVAVDGPRTDRKDEEEKCCEVRECVKLIDWPCEVQTRFSEKNLGCKYAVNGAITWFFENEESGIVLEDDCRPTIDFLRFASEMLIRYKDDERIGAVNGFNRGCYQSDKTCSYHFSAHMSVWGWASWRRVWKNYNVDLESCSVDIPDVLKRVPLTRYMRRFYARLAADLSNGLSTWDVQFSILLFSKGWLSIVPRERLVVNSGVADDRATHTGGYVYWAKDWVKAGRMDFPMRHPEAVVCDRQADRTRELYEGAFFPRGLTWLGSKFPSMCKVLTSLGEFVEWLAPWLFKL